MTSNETIRLSNQTARRRVATRVIAGAENMVKSPVLFACFAALIVLETLLFVFREAIVIATVPTILVAMMVDFATVLAPIYMIGILVGYLMIIGTPWNARGISDNLHRAGVFNKIEEAPILMHKYQDENNPRITILDFKSTGISRTTWEDLQAEIESALNCYVVKIQEGKHQNRMLLHIVASSDKLPEKILWTEDHMVDDDCTLVLGQTVAGTDVTADLSRMPHILIGGATGSGKTVLLKHLLWQCISKGAEVYIADFKGGVDFGCFWEKHATLILDEQTLLTQLADIVHQLEERKQLFRNANVANIAEYNQKTGANLKRIIFACDEIAELLDKTGASKEQKAVIDQITSYLSTISRQARAFGGSFLAGTQRPSADVLVGQIKNNFSLRACGVADQVLSNIVLDRPDAADLIPKDSHKFLMDDGTVFQPYYFEEPDRL